LIGNLSSDQHSSHKMTETKMKTGNGNGN